MTRKPSITSRLAGYTKGRIWINKRVKGPDRKRLLRHETKELALRKKGMSYKRAHKLAGKYETKGMTTKQILKYSGRLGAIARWHPRKARR